jgi:hypothetical protein
LSPDSKMFTQMILPRASQKAALATCSMSTPKTSAREVGAPSRRRV